MRIYHSPRQDLMVLDSLGGMNATHQRLREFLASGQRAVVFEAQRSGSPEPYESFLGALKFEVGEGPISVSITPDNHLKVVGSRENLAAYASYFAFRESEEGSHHHPEQVDRPGYISSGSLSIIIEVDTDHIREMEGES